MNSNHGQTGQQFLVNFKKLSVVLNDFCNALQKTFPNLQVYDPAHVYEGLKVVIEVLIYCYM